MNAPQPQDLMLAIETVHVRFVLVWCGFGQGVCTLTISSKVEISLASRRKGCQWR
jgi:hypothetical protein